MHRSIVHVDSGVGGKRERDGRGAWQHVVVVVGWFRDSTLFESYSNSLISVVLAASKGGRGARRSVAWSCADRYFNGAHISRYRIHPIFQSCVVV